MEEDGTVGGLTGVSWRETRTEIVGGEGGEEEGNVEELDSDGGRGWS